MKYVNAPTASQAYLYTHQLRGNWRMLGILERNSQGNFAEVKHAQSELLTHNIS